MESVKTRVKTRVSPILQGLQQGLQEQAQRVRSLPANAKVRIEKEADQILLGLSHSGSQLLEQTFKRIDSNPSDLIGRVGRSVLERAEGIRRQISNLVPMSGFEGPAKVPEKVKAAAQSAMKSALKTAKAAAQQKSKPMKEKKPKSAKAATKKKKK